jgi:hypothetical protein
MKLSKKTKQELKSFQQFAKEFTAKNCNKTPEKSNELWKKEVGIFFKENSFSAKTIHSLST